MHTGRGQQPPACAACAACAAQPITTPQALLPGGPAARPASSCWACAHARAYARTYNGSTQYSTEQGRSPPGCKAQARAMPGRLLGACLSAGAGMTRWALGARHGTQNGNASLWSIDGRRFVTRAAINSSCTVRLAAAVMMRPRDWRDGAMCCQQSVAHTCVQAAPAADSARLARQNTAKAERRKRARIGAANT